MSETNLDIAKRYLLYARAERPVARSLCHGAFGP